MPRMDGEPGVDLHVRAYLVSKLKLMHERLARLQGQGTEDSPAPEAAVEGAATADVSSLIDHLPFAVFTLDLVGRFLYCNRKAEQLSGYTREELVGKGYYDTELVRFRDLIKITALFGLAKREPETGPFRLTAWRKDGSQIKLEVTARLVPGGRARQLLCIARDIAARARAEAAPAGPAEGETARPARGTVPLSICGTCKRVEDIDGDWLPLEYFLYKRLELEFTHETCPDCMEKRRRGEFA